MDARSEIVFGLRMSTLAAAPAAVGASNTSRVPTVHVSFHRHIEMDDYNDAEVCLHARFC